MSNRSLIVAALVVCGCNVEPETISSSLDLAFPSSGDTRTQTVRLDIEVHAPTDGVCVALANWRNLTCDKAATDCRDYQFDPASEAVARATIEKRADGTWPDFPIALDVVAIRDVLVFGYSASDSKPFIYGCATLGTTETKTLELWRPWCDSNACASVAHAACLPELLCPPQDGVTEPTCRPQLVTAQSWEQGGTACVAEQTQSATVGACALATIACGDDYRVTSDGQCPMREPTCSDDRIDLDCDGIPAEPCPADCVNGERRSFGRTDTRGDQRARLCVNEVCENARFVEVYEEVQGPEICDGFDNDCNGVFDDPAATAEVCARGGTADVCVDRQCQCGDRPACPRELTCVRSQCTDLHDGGSPRDGGPNRPRDGGRVDIRDGGVSTDAGPPRDAGQRRDAQ